jgi:hypothetical protein
MVGTEAGMVTAAELLPAVDTAVAAAPVLRELPTRLRLSDETGWPQPVMLWFLSVLANAARASLLL